MADDDSKTGFELWLGGIMPACSYAANNVPPAPDYADAGSWAATPTNPAGSAFVPAGHTATGATSAKADVFYVHPTTSVGTVGWNADISGPAAATRASEIVDHLIMPGQASLFNGACRVFAPRYRQAVLAAFFVPGPDGRAALDLAYSDVARAFAHYLTHENDGRPFILAGHSQGCALLMRLLAEGFDTALRPQLVAAYLLGYKVTDEAVASFAHVVTPAEGASDTGIFVAYDSFLDGTDAHRQPDYAEHWLPSGWKARAGQNVISINPVNWSRSKASTASAHAGFGVVTVNKPNLLAALYMPGSDDGVGLEATGLSGPVMPGVAVSIDMHGYLKISLPEQSFMNAGIFGGNYHNRDLALFYMDLRANVVTRVEAFCA